MDLALPVFRGEQTIMQGVQAGMFSNLGRGDVPIAEMLVVTFTAGCCESVISARPAR